MSRNQQEESQYAGGSFIPATGVTEYVPKTELLATYEKVGNVLQEQYNTKRKEYDALENAMANFQVFDKETDDPHVQRINGFLKASMEEIRKDDAWHRAGNLMRDVTKGITGDAALKSIAAQVTRYTAEKNEFDEEAKKNISQIVKSFEDARTAKFIQYFVGNGALSKTELETVLPIYLD